MNYIEADLLKQAMSYTDYSDLMDQLSKEGKTTGSKQSEALINFTKLNFRRMLRVFKTFKLDTKVKEELQQINRPMTWLVLTESWCGDAAQVIPIIERMAQEIPAVEIKLILRDEHPEIMDAFLTAGARSIPKIVFIDKIDNQVLGAWGPRPAALHKLVLENKEERLKEPDVSKRGALYEVFSIVLQKWYNKDKGKSTEQEFLQALKNALSAEKVKLA